MKYTPFTIYKLFIITLLLFLSACSTNRHLTRLNPDKVTYMALVPNIGKDAKIKYYYTDNPKVINHVIRDLKRGLPSLLSVLGSDYGFPNFQLEVTTNTKEKQYIGIIPTSGIERAFYSNRNSLNYISMTRYMLDKKERGHELLKELNKNDIKWYNRMSHTEYFRSNKYFKYSILVEGISKVSKTDSEKKTKEFIDHIQARDLKMDYDIGSAYSSEGYPIRVTFYVTTMEEIKSIEKIAKQFSYDVLIDNDPVEIYIEDTKDIGLSKIIDNFKLRIESLENY